MDDSDDSSDPTSEMPDGGPEPTSSAEAWRRRAPMLAVAALVAVVLVAIAFHGSGSGGRTDLTSQVGPTTTAQRSGTSQTTSMPAGPTTSAGGQVPPTTSGPSDEMTTSTTEPPSTTTTLPGVVDDSDPAAITKALVDLAATGVEPEEGRMYLKGGNPGIARELFMFAAEGLSKSDVHGCGVAGMQAHCSVSMQASYGARATAEVTLTRAGSAVPWTVSAIKMSHG